MFSPANLTFRKIIGKNDFHYHFKNIIVRYKKKLEIVHANRTTKCMRNQCRTKGEGWSTANKFKLPPPPPPPVILLLAVPNGLFCFDSLVILDMVCRYLSLFLLYINVKIGTNTC